MLPFQKNDKDKNVSPMVDSVTLPSNDPEKEPDHGMLAVAHDLINAIKEGSADKVAEALKACLEIYEGNE